MRSWLGRQGRKGSTTGSWCRAVGEPAEESSRFFAKRVTAHVLVRSLSWARSDAQPLVFRSASDESDNGPHESAGEIDLGGNCVRALVTGLRRFPSGPTLTPGNWGQRSRLTRGYEAVRSATRAACATTGRWPIRSTSGMSGQPTMSSLAAATSPGWTRCRAVGPETTPSHSLAGFCSGNKDRRRRRGARPTTSSRLSRKN